MDKPSNPPSTEALDTTEEPKSTYEQMCIWLYAYRYEAMGFLELIAKFEQILGLRSPQTPSRTICAQ